MDFCFGMLGCGYQIGDQKIVTHNTRTHKHLYMKKNYQKRKTHLFFF